MIEPQWPAVSTQSGATSVPVQRKLLPRWTSAIDGYAPAAASWPPTMAWDGAAVSASAAEAVAMAIESLRGLHESLQRSFEARTCGDVRDLRPMAATATERDDVQPVANENLDRFLTGTITVLPILALGVVAWQVWS